MMNISPLAAKPAPQSILVDIPQLMTAYYLGARRHRSMQRDPPLETPAPRGTDLARPPRPRSGLARLYLHVCSEDRHGPAPCRYGAVPVARRLPVRQRTDFRVNGCQPLSVGAA